jgi:HSP20 family molecular chaperone IbpA
MSLFPRSFYAPDQSFAPLVRLLNDWDTYAREGQLESGTKRHHTLQTFNPKFDVIESDSEYQLHGELGGIAKQDVHIEFTDDHTLVIKGRVEKSYTTGEPAEASGAITEPAAPEKETAGNGHQAAARDEEDERQAKGAQVTTTNKQQAMQHQKQKPTFKYWLSERSVGEFSRVFQFPGRVERDNVSASLDNGILTVKVPKAKKLETRRINIS